MKYSKALAKEILSLWKRKSPLFNGAYTSGDLEFMLSCPHPVGPGKLTQADMICIEMTLRIAGVKFKND